MRAGTLLLLCILISIEKNSTVTAGNNTVSAGKKNQVATKLHKNTPTDSTTPSKTSQGSPGRLGATRSQGDPDVEADHETEKFLHRALNARRGQRGGVGRGTDALGEVLGRGVIFTGNHLTRKNGSRGGCGRMEWGYGEG